MTKQNSNSGTMAMCQTYEHFQHMSVKNITCSKTESEIKHKTTCTSARFLKILSGDGIYNFKKLLDKQRYVGKKKRLNIPQIQILCQISRC